MSSVPRVPRQPQPATPEPRPTAVSASALDRHHAGWAMFEPLRKYAVFRGRATRTEYWQWMLFQFVLLGLLGSWVASTLPPVDVDAAALGLPYDPAYFVNLPNVLTSLVSLALVIPNLAVAVRRLHDSDRSGWWLLLNLFPGFGQFVMFIFMVLDGSVGPNRHGSDPRGRVMPAYR